MVLIKFIYMSMVMVLDYFMDKKINNKFFFFFFLIFEYIFYSKFLMLFLYIMKKFLFILNYNKIYYNQKRKNWWNLFLKYYLLFYKFLKKWQVSFKAYSIVLFSIIYNSMPTGFKLKRYSMYYYKLYKNKMELQWIYFKMSGFNVWLHWNWFFSYNILECHSSFVFPTSLSNFFLIYYYIYMFLYYMFMNFIIMYNKLSLYLIKKLK